MESLQARADRLACSPAFRAKQDIARVAAMVDVAPRAVCRWREIDERIALGDDTAAIPDGDGYLLFAAEGILPEFLERDPYFAGWSSVMVNVSDVAAMGGYPLAVVDVYFQSSSDADRVLGGLRDASRAYGVPLVGGHTTRRLHGPHALAVAILGRAESLLTSSGARPGDVVVFVVDLRGAYRGDFPFWNASSERSPDALRSDLAVFGPLSASGRVHACKDVSNAGIAGTLLMMLEASGVGAMLDLDGMPRPPGVDLDRWLQTFPSYGFLLAVPSAEVASVRSHWQGRGITCEAVGRFDDSRTLTFEASGETALLWDLSRNEFTGFSPQRLT
jgi:AIR synthase-related protein